MLLVAVQGAFAQTYTVKGKIVDGNDKTPLAGVLVKVADKEQGAITNEDGEFTIAAMPKGTYTIEFSYLSYKKLQQQVTVKDKNIALGTVKMEVESKVLKDATVKGVANRVTLSGDTMQFNADAYKVNPNATAEDLVKKMPGVTYDASGNMQVNGESVKKVMVDGKEFFGNDPNTAMRNLPADIISKVQVFDNMSDQARFTGFSDGTTDAALNIITKDGMSKGQFGRVYAGYGTDNRYQAGLSLNFFNDDQRISLLGMSNNINQQNFSISDVMGLMSGDGGSRRRGPRSGNQGGLDVRNLLHGQNNSGNTTVHAGGINYIDQWGKKVKITGSYFFNQSNNVNEASLTRNYFTDAQQVYKEQSTTNTTNINHRANMRLEYTIDKNNSIVYTPSFTIQQNKYSTDLLGTTTVGTADVLSNAVNSQYAYNSGYNFSNDLLFRHKFNKKGRTLSVGLSANLSESDGEGDYYSLTEQVQGGSDALLDQQYDLSGNSKTYSANLTYTEAIGKNGQLMLAYKPSVNTNASDKTTMDLDTAIGDYTSFNTTLSNKYNSSYTTQRGGVTYKLNIGKSNISVGADVQSAKLEGEQTFPASGFISRSFTNILPEALFSYRKGKGTSVRVMYRSSTNAPEITDLQNVVDISNPLLLSTGNPGLVQNFQNSLMVHYRNVDMKTSRMFFSMFRGSYTKDYISTQTIIPTADTVVNDVTVRRGSQITMPVNVNGYYNLRTFAVYGVPVSLIKSNVNLSGGVTYTRTPSLLNNETNISNNTVFNLRTYIGSNISEKVDFNVSYTGTYNMVTNSLQTQSDNNYFTHIATVGANFTLGNRIVLNTDYNYTTYNGLTDGFDQSFHLWNASLGYKLLKNKQLEAKVSVFDILNQNTDISRTVTQTYTQDSRSTVLQQYFMFTLTYNIKNFKSGDVPEVDGPPKGMPPPPHFRGR